MLTLLQNPLNRIRGFSKLCRQSVSLAAKSSLFLGSALLTPALVYAQQPGGVAGATVWLRADQGLTLSGSSATAWANQSNGTNNFAGTGTLTFSNNAVNFNPDIKFLNSYFTSSNLVPSVANAPYTRFVIYKPNGSGANNIVGSSAGANASTLWGSSTTTDLAIFHSAQNRLLASNVVSTSRPYLAMSKFKLGATDETMIRVDGQTKAKATTSTGYITANLQIGAFGGSNTLNGQVAEVIFYETNLDALQIRKVESYLAIKYGHTLSADDNNNGTKGEVINGSITEGDYLLSDGTVAWKYTDNSAYVNNIAGIGRDDGSAFIQKQSQSIITGIPQVTLALGVAAASNNENTNNVANDKQFLIWGDNGLPLSQTAPVFGSAQVNNRYSRVWKLQNTNSFNAPISVYLPQQNRGDVYLLYGSTPESLSNGTATEVPSSGNLTINGVVQDAFNVTLPTDSPIYFSFGVSCTAAVTTGPASFCGATTIQLANTEPASTTATVWQSSNPAVATVNYNGVVRGISAGTVTIAYTNASGCFAYKTISVTSCAEICGNGIDDDFDGYIDQADSDCTETPACIIPAPDISTFNIAAKWKSTSGNLFGCSSSPTIGDLDGDGLPEILVNKASGEGVVYLKGDGSNAGKTAADYNLLLPIAVGETTVQPAIADIDNDGTPEVILVGRDGYIYVFNNVSGNSSTYKFKSASVVNTNYINGSPRIVDIDEDGKPEIIVGIDIFQFDFSNNTLTKVVAGVATLPNGSDHHNWGQDIVVIDIMPDNPGKEIVAGSKVFAVNLITGTLTTLADLSTVSGSGIPANHDGPTAVADLDNDGNLDIAYTSSNLIIVWDPISKLLKLKIAYQNISNIPYRSQPTIANVYNEIALAGKATNLPEIIFAGSTYLSAYNLNNLTRSIWNIAVTDQSGETGVTSFDLNGDGVQEIIYNDQSQIRVINGNSNTPANVFQINSGTATWMEHPVVADVNNDGAAEFVVVSAGSLAFQGTVNVYGAADGSTPWAPARKLWNGRGYRSVNINDDFSIPRVEQDIRKEYPIGTGLYPFNTYNVQNTVSPVPNGFQMAPDLQISELAIGAACAFPTDAVAISYKVTNGGSAVAPASTPIRYYIGNPTLPGATRIANTDSLATPLSIAANSNKLDTLDLTGFTAPYDLYVVLNDDGTSAIPLTLPISSTNIGECSYENNTAFVTIAAINLQAPPQLVTDTETKLAYIMNCADENGFLPFVDDILAPTLKYLAVHPNAVTGYNFNTAALALNNHSVLPGDIANQRKTDGSNNTTALANRMYTIVNTGTPVLNGSSFTVRLYFDPADLLAAKNNLDPAVGGVADGKWFKLEGTSLDVLADQTPSGFSGAHALQFLESPVYGTENGVNYVEFTGISSFSTFGYLANKTENPLPVTLISFQASAGETGGATLDWKTTAEANSSHYELQFSADGKQFYAIATVESQNSANGASYTYEYNQAPEGLSYYRLKSVDTDGSFAYSKIVSLRLEENGTAISIAPNPVSSILTVRGLVGKNTLSLYDITGKPWLNTTSNASSKSILVGQLPTGIYIVKIEGEHGIVSYQKFVKE